MKVLKMPCFGGAGMKAPAGCFARRFLYEGLAKEPLDGL